MIKILLYILPFGLFITTLGIKPWRKSEQQSYLALLPQELKELLSQFIAQTQTAKSLNEVLKNLQELAKVKQLAPALQTSEFQQLLSLPKEIKRANSIKEVLQKLEALAHNKIVAHLINTPQFQELFLDLKRIEQFSIYGYDYDTALRFLLGLAINKNLSFLFDNPDFNRHLIKVLGNQQIYHKDPDITIAAALGTPGALLWREHVQLIDAAKRGDNKTAKDLLNKGSDVDVKDTWGYTPLMMAINWGSNEIAKMLIDAGADVNAQNINGYTALMYAAEQGDKDLVTLLLAKGADATIATTIGYTALKLANERGHKDIVEMLQNAGAVK